MLCPLRFKPILKERLWGGRRLDFKSKKKISEDTNIGESWEISGVEGDISVVANGNLKGNSLNELIEVYMGDLVGDKVYDKYGDEFPLLFKFIDAQDELSIQVHPNDELAKTRHNAYGKSELWYIVDCQDNAAIYVGFNKDVTQEEFIACVADGSLIKILNRIEVKKGDSFYIPAGTIHAISKGCVIAEIQQSSDITYRVYDWGRVDSHGNKRELHVDLALAAINFKRYHHYNNTHKVVKNSSVQLTSSNYFTANLIDIEDNVIRDYSDTDSFVVYMCVEGNITVECDIEGKGEKISKFDTLLIPASVYSIGLSGKGKVLEIFV